MFFVFVFVFFNLAKLGNISEVGIREGTMFLIGFKDILQNLLPKVSQVTKLGKISGLPQQCFLAMLARPLAN